MDVPRKPPDDPSSREPLPTHGPPDDMPMTRQGPEEQMAKLPEALASKNTRDLLVGQPGGLGRVNPDITAPEGRRPREAKAGKADAPVASDEPREPKSDGERVELAKHIVTAIVEDAYLTLADPKAKDLVLVSSKLGEADEAAELVTAARQLVHQGALGEPARRALENAGAPASVADGIGDVVAYLPLPVDGVLLLLRRSGQVLGVVAGVVNGQPVLAITSLKNLLVDEAIRYGKQQLVNLTVSPTDHDTVGTSAQIRKSGWAIEELVAAAKSFGWLHLIPGHPAA